MSAPTRDDSRDYKSGYLEAVIDVLKLIEQGCPNCEEVCLTQTDCCEYTPRWKCQTGLSYDVRACLVGYGCSLEGPK